MAVKERRKWTYTIPVPKSSYQNTDSIQVGKIYFISFQWKDYYFSMTQCEIPPDLMRLRLPH